MSKYSSYALGMLFQTCRRQRYSWLLRAFVVIADIEALISANNLCILLFLANLVYLVVRYTRQ